MRETVAVPSDAPEPQPNASAGERITYSFTPAVAERLESAGATLAVTTYQAGRLLLLRAHDGRLNLLMRQFEKPMGLAVQDGRLALGTRRQIWHFDGWIDPVSARPESGSADPGSPRSSSQPDAGPRFVPRRSWVTGDVSVHEVAWLASASAEAPPRIGFLATRFGCLAEVDEVYSFRPIWTPPFISALRPEDRCHLNGLAVHEGRPYAVTVLGLTDTPQGWRERKADGGAVIDVQTGEVRAEGLSMPHSPRLWRDRLLVLNSGRGELLEVEANGGTRVIATLPGFPRGLAIFGDLAFVGLSKIREKKQFGGLPIERLRDRLECGVHVIDLHTGGEVGRIRFDSGAHELFDVQILPCARWTTNL